MEVIDTPSISDKKKRSLEALERRFTKTVSQNQRATLSSPSVVSGSPVLPKSVERSSFSYGSNKIHKESDEPIYSKLSNPVHENLVASEKQALGSGSIETNVVKKIINNLLESGNKAGQYMKGTTRKNIENYLLLDDHVQSRDVSMKAHRRLLQRHTKRSKHHMSLKQHKLHGSFDVPEKFHNYEFCKPMNQMWEEYIKKLLYGKRKNQIAQCLLTADLHGAVLLVCESKILGFTGSWGIMIRETAETFGIVTVENVFRVVPKRGSVLMFQANGWKITLIGDKLVSRNKLRSFLSI